ncbi:hypothetical protein ABB27_09205 [Stenotrophomonas terrae]|uniref:TonB-dependent receptor n=1 Tax=Stenotrophomonas terrae TaxID=405446 RepID=A0A0R0CEQ5_9GAMM|nr:hypothetical protein [Stenotrophomonas terrae]KRG67728.1 hypothetical protein ABB27_09205 [Stenotrophomonas terrae]
MKRRLLDCTLAGLLASGAAAAQVPPGVASPAAEAPALDCSDNGCSNEQGLLFQLRTRSYDQPVTTGTSPRSSIEALQPDRRVTVARELPGQAIAVGRFSVQLADGGVVWATEDPNLGQPELAVSAPSFAAYDGQSIIAPVRFAIRSNYPAFIQRMELRVYRAADLDLIEPLATVAVAPTGVAQAEWDGVLPARYRYRAGDDLVYLLRAYAADGAWDETAPSRLQLVTPEEAERGNRALRDTTEKALGSALSVDQAQQQRLVDDVFSRNGLRQQNIAVYGSRVRIQGRNLPQGRSLSINGEPYPVDLEGKFVAEFLMPVGRHGFDIAVQGPGQGSATPVAQHQQLEVDVSGSYFFGIGLADVTIAQNDIGRSTAPLSVDGRYRDDIISDGRLAFYLKAKARAKYLITAQADTTEQDLGHLFDGLTSATPQDIFRRLDPDLYYPTYGDDSSTYRDVDTMGRFYLRVDWDKNQALWGNYATGLTGTEYAQYVRSLYGAAVNWRSRAINAWGDPRTELRGFGSQAETAPGHNEFAGTGGSLYYLRNTDILPGSDIVVLEIRDPATGRVEQRVPLVRGVDYQINELQGRLLLTRPLAQITRENVPTLTRDSPLDGYEQRLVVDYEWVPSDFDDDNITAGVRAKQWLGDHLGVGVTYVKENRSGEDYTLSGADLTLQAGKGTYLKAEYAHTESFGAPVFYSDNGGMSFVQSNRLLGQRKGDARSIEARANFKELGWTTLDWSAGAWWRDTDAGYSTARYDTNRPVTEYGAELLGQLTNDLSLYARYSRAEIGRQALTQAQASLEWRIGDYDTLSGEVRRVEEQRLLSSATGVLGALKYAHQFGTSLNLYGLVQATLDDDGGQYEDNNALVAGGKYLFGDQSSVTAEGSVGDRGNAALLSGEYRLTPEHSLYAGYTYSTDITDQESLFEPNRQNGWTLGQRWRLSERSNMFNESQFIKEPQQSGLAHTYGMDFYPAQGWNMGFTLQSGDLEKPGGANVDRRAVSISGGHTSPAADWQSKIEWRRDQGAENRTQWVTTNRLTWKINESWRIAARINYSDTDDDYDRLANARFMESNLGFAWRPWNSTRWALFGRYTYLYDLATLGQVGGAQYDQRTQVLSLEGVYKQDQHWEYAVKLARREGDVRMQRGYGPWFDSATNFAAAQLRYELRTQWHALAEYRWLDVADGGTRQGFLVGLDRDISRNFRLGVGYNFTEFSDDLTNFDYDHRGWFLNMTGMY